MRSIIILLLLIAATQMSYAQQPTKKERTVELWGHTVDYLTNAGIPGTKVTLMTADSIIVDSMEVKFFTPYKATKPDAYYKFLVPARKASYIILATHPDYEPLYINYEIKYVARNTFFDVPWHYMNKRRVTELDEFVVSATKIRFYHDGDTIVYNADAFNLPTGSMLDGLIAQLPGAKLNEAGEITVDGRKIENLTLNGKDFFRGNNRIMLDNLPAYTVENVKVYDKSTERSEWLGREVEEKVFTMDILLKKEYLKGITANAEVAAGTYERYLARLFGLRYTDNSRITLWGNANNINEVRRPAQNGSWAASNMPERERTSKMAGLDLLIDDKEKRWSENAAVSLSYNKSDVENASSGERFMPSGNIHTLGYNRSTALGTLNFYLDNEFRLKKPFLLVNKINLQYITMDNENINSNATFSSSPNSYGAIQGILDTLFAQSADLDLQRIAINRNRTSGLSDFKQLYGNFDINATHKLKNGDDIVLVLNATYSDLDEDTRTARQLFYYNNLHEDNRRERIDNGNKKLEGKFKFDYNIHWLNHWNLTMYYNLDAASNDEHNNFYHSAVEDEALASMSVSALTAMPPLLDAGNSYSYTTSGATHRVGVNPWYSKTWGKNFLRFYLALPLNLREDHIDFAGAHTTADFSLRKVLFNPSVSLAYGVNNRRKLYRLDYTMIQTMPSLVSMVDYTTNSNPLNVRKGNPNLGVYTQHKLVLQYNRRYDKRQARFNLWSTIKLHENMVATHVTYNPKNGQYTSRPQNVNGNWHGDIGYNIYTMIDNKERFSFYTETMFDYDRNVDLALLSNSNVSARSIVNNYQATEEVKFEFNSDGLTLGLGAKLVWRNASSERSEIKSINIFDHKYAANLIYRLPYKFSIATDFNLYARNGYAAEGMNKSDFVWNASLSRPVGDDWTMRIQAFDILHNLSGKSVVVNGQGRTETFTNVLPSYVMLHLQYKFNYTPKKRR